MKPPDLTPDLFLLVHDPDTGRHAAGRSAVRTALVGAALAEMVVAGRVGVDGGHVTLTGRRVVGGSDVTEFVVDTIATQEVTHPVAAWGAALGEAVHELVARDLVDAGVVRRERVRVRRGTAIAAGYPAVDAQRVARPRLEVEHMVRAPRAFDLAGAVAVALLLALDAGPVPGADPALLRALLAELPADLRELVVGLAGGAAPEPLPDGRFAGSRLLVECAVVAARAARPTARTAPAALRAWHDDAARRFAGGDAPGAVPLLEQAVADCGRDLGWEHPDTLTAEGNLAVAYLASGRADVGVPLLVATCADRERVLGADHPATLTARDVLAAVHRAAGRPAEARALHAVVAGRRARVLGARHTDTLLSRLGEGLSAADLGDPRTALAVLGPARDAAVETLTGGSTVPGAELTVALRAALASCLAAAERPAQARVELAAALRTATATLGPSHPDTRALRALSRAAARSPGRSPP